MSTDSRSAPHNAATHNTAPHNAATYNTIVIGAGPIGIEVAAALKSHDVRYLHIEAGQIGHSLTRWTPQTVFYSSPEWIALCGIPIQTADQRQIDGESYLAYMRQLVEILELPINTFEKVIEIAPLTDSDAPPKHAEPSEHTEPPNRTAPHSPAPNAAPRFVVTTQSRAGTHYYRTTHIVLAVGNMQLYNSIDTPGINQPHISHALAHPHTYFQKELLIIGGKNSALEAALRCWRAGARVRISYRNAKITNKGVLDRIFLELQLLIRNKQVILLASTVPMRFTATTALLKHITTEQQTEVPTDFVYIATGYKPDYTLYEQAGITLIGEQRRPMHNPDTMETNVAGVYVAGTAIAGNERRYTVFITTCHHHASRIATAISGRSDISAATGNYRTRDYPLTDYDLE